MRVEGRVVRDGRLEVGQRAAIALGPPARRPAPVALLGSLGLVHEDEHLLVVDKPPGLLTIATGSGRERTAYRMVRGYLASARPPGPAFIVHRLDRDTSGLIAFAKSPEAKRRLQAQFAARTVERVYLAVVEGAVARDAGTIESRLVEDRSLRVRSARGAGRHRPGAGGRDAITHYRVLQRRPRTTLLEVVLGTGRRRQIRAQLAAMGHPVVGDAEAAGPGEGRRVSRAPAASAPRLLLHATRLGFTHPVTGEHMRFDSPPPPAFAWRGAPRASARNPSR